MLRTARPVVSFAAARELAARWGTPLLVVSRSVLAEQYAALRRALPGVELHYAMKANPEPEVLRTLARLDAAVEVAGHAEAEAALVSGFAADRVLHTHPCAAEADLTASCRAGVRWFTFDSQEQLHKLARCAPAARLVLRLAVSPGAAAIDLSARFGASLAEADSLLAAAGERGLTVAGLAFHVGSQCLDPLAFVSALGVAREVWDRAAQAGQRLELLSLGGGFPAPAAQGVLQLNDYCAPIRRALEEHFGTIRCRVVAEPGRALVAEAGTLLARVVARRTRGEQICYTLDDGVYGSLSSVYHDRLELPLLVERQGPLHASLLAGPTCAPQDVLARDVLLPVLEEGDLMLIPAMGAYSTARSTPFNSMRQANILLID